MSKNENLPLIRRHIRLEELLQLATPDEGVFMSAEILARAISSAPEIIEGIKSGLF